MLTDVPILDRPALSDTTVLPCISEHPQWPTHDPDEATLAEARAAFYYPTEPDLPILTAVLEGLRQLAA